MPRRFINITIIIIIIIIIIFIIYIYTFFFFFLGGGGVKKTGITGKTYFLTLIPNNKSILSPSLGCKIHI